MKYSIDTVVSTITICGYLPIRWVREAFVAPAHATLPRKRRRRAAELSIRGGRAYTGWVVSGLSLLGAIWLRRGCGIAERVPRPMHLVNPVEKQRNCERRLRSRRLITGERST